MLRVSLICCVFLACASIASAGEPANGLRTQEGGTAYAIGSHAPGSAEAESALVQADASQSKDPQAAAMLSILADRYRAQYRFATAGQLYQRAPAAAVVLLVVVVGGVAAYVVRQVRLHRSALAEADPH